MYGYCLWGKIVFFEERMRRVEELVHQTAWSREINIPNIFKTSLGRDSQVAQLKNPPVNAGDAGSIPGLWRSPRGENGNNPLWYSCLWQGKNPMDRGAWWATVHGVAKNQKQQHACTFVFLHLENCMPFIYIAWRVKTKKDQLIKITENLFSVYILLNSHNTISTRVTFLRARRYIWRHTLDQERS